MSMDFSPGWCAHCANTGYIDCHCGGDLCICENNSEEPCPYCDQTGDGFYCDEIEGDEA
jgi:hypothetical protein